MDLRFTHTHVYPGCRATSTGAVPTGSEPSGVEFADGTVVVATLTLGDEGSLRLSVPGYITARGGRIEPKAWRLQRFEDGWIVRRKTTVPKSDEIDPGRGANGRHSRSRGDG